MKDASIAVCLYPLTDAECLEYVENDETWINRESVTRTDNCELTACALLTDTES
jgi:hypothetical protein